MYHCSLKVYHYHFTVYQYINAQSTTGLYHRILLNLCSVYHQTACHCITAHCTHVSLHSVYCSVYQCFPRQCTTVQCFSQSLLSVSCNTALCFSLSQFSKVFFFHLGASQLGAEVQRSLWHSLTWGVGEGRQVRWLAWLAWLSWLIGSESTGWSGSSVFPAGADRRSGDVVGQRGLAWFLKALLELPSAPSPETFHSSSASF